MFPDRVRVVSIYLFYLFSLLPSHGKINWLFLIIILFTFSLHWSLPGRGWADPHCSTGLPIANGLWWQKLCLRCIWHSLSEIYVLYHPDISTDREMEIARRDIMATDLAALRSARPDWTSVDDTLLGMITHTGWTKKKEPSYGTSKKAMFWLSFSNLQSKLFWETFKFLKLP